MINLENLCKEYKVFIDTCSLMLPGSEVFYKNLYDALYKSNTKLILAMRVYNELRHQEKSVDMRAKKLAKEGLKFINNLINGDLIDLREEENEVVGGSKNFADPLFPMVFSKNRLKYNLCLITQDRKLSMDMINIKNSQSVLSDKQIEILYIDNKDYNLRGWEPRLENTYNWVFGGKQNIKDTHIYRGIKKEIFNLSKAPLKKKEQLLSVGGLPSSGDYIYSSNKEKIKLVKFIASGGEGELFETNNGLVCKVYKKECLTNIRESKLKLMLSKHITIDGVCLPKDLAFNSQKQFIGYLMDKAQGHILQTSVFGKPVLKNKFPKWKREHLVQLALTIVITIKKLHDRNIIIGDINPSNILVVNERKVFFVDTDSYQVEGFPCPVGTPTFTPPELQGVNYADILRTKDHEMFAVATLIFMILFPGKTPYSSQGGEDLITNIKNRNFSYIRGKGEADKKPFGSWRFIWSHLHNLIKSNFEKIFSDGDKVTIEEWSKSLGIYLDGIKKDYSSNDLFPSRYKFNDAVAVECVECHKSEEMSASYFNKLKDNKWPPRCSRCREIYKLKKEMGVEKHYTKNYQTHTKKNTHNHSHSSINKNQHNRYKKPSQNSIYGALKLLKRIFI